MRVLASGTAEKWIKEGKAAPPPGPASPATACGPVRCACSWGHRVQPRTFLRRLTLPLAIQSWSLTSPPAAAIQDRRAPHPTCPVLRPAAYGTLLDAGSL